MKRLTLAAARSMGAAAHARGVEATPLRDREFMAALATAAGKIGATLPYLAAWEEGWHGANLAAPCEECNGRGMVWVKGLDGEGCFDVCDSCPRKK